MYNNTYNYIETVSGLLPKEAIIEVISQKVKSSKTIVCSRSKALSERERILMPVFWGAAWVQVKFPLSLIKNPYGLKPTEEIGAGIPHLLAPPKPWDAFRLAVKDYFQACLRWKEEKLKEDNVIWASCNYYPKRPVLFAKDAEDYCSKKVPYEPSKKRNVIEQQALVEDLNRQYNDYTRRIDTAYRHRDYRSANYLTVKREALLERLLDEEDYLKSATTTTVLIIFNHYHPTYEKTPGMTSIKLNSQGRVFLNSAE